MVGIDLGEKPEVVRDFRKRLHVTFPILMGPKPGAGFGGLPYNLVLDRQGIVRYSKAGFLLRSEELKKSVGELQKIVAELLAEPLPANPPQPTTRAAP